MKLVAALTLVAALGSHWVSTCIKQHRKEQLAIRNLQRLSPKAIVQEFSCVWGVFCALGFRPKWMMLVGSVDLTGQMLVEEMIVYTKQPEIDNAVFNQVTPHLLAFPYLDELYLNNAAIDDDVVEQLAPLKSVRFLSIHDTSISKLGALRLMKLLPNTRVVGSP